jgi:hypothetical protein
MNREIKVGDYAIPPNECDSYLSAGKKYEIIGVRNHDFFKIQDDDGEILFCGLYCCTHLNGQNWIIEPKPEQA